MGFRPFVYRLAKELQLSGWVQNSSQGVWIEVEGSAAVLQELLLRMNTDKPPLSSIQSLEASWLDPKGSVGFEIRSSESGGKKTALVLPDIGTCADCLLEIFDPGNRRYRYPFTNCTNCGPRFSIIESLPYDRANTTMRRFTLCAECRAEYEDPSNRRFHAQPNACPACGPVLEAWVSNGAGGCVAQAGAAMGSAVHAIQEGKIVAVKGIGGFHLLVDARNEKAVLRLRERKHREEKPFAVMFPSLPSVQQCCHVCLLEQRLLRSPEAPIVLLDKNSNEASPVARSVAPGCSTLGVMLPSNPLHHLLMSDLNFPVVATSGNLSNEPICTDEGEARERLGGIADLLLVHNRAIVRHVDDSITRMMAGREMVLRRARGYAPLPIVLALSEPTASEEPILAVGAHLKNSIALAVRDQVFISQHIGDLESEPAWSAFRRVIRDFERLYEAAPQVVAADLHPDYLSTKWAHEYGKPVRNVQHHVAHCLACLAENEVTLPALGVSWDGTGLGPDATIWGGEFFRITDQSAERVAHFRMFRLPGGDQAMVEPRRAALGLLYEILGEKTFESAHSTALGLAFSSTELAALKTMLLGGIQAPWTSSVGRLFDGVAGLTGGRRRIAYEGQAAMELEFALARTCTNTCYELPLVVHDKMLVLDWAPMIEAILADAARGEPRGEISAKFHNTLVESIIVVARRLELARVALSGGCFQNRYLVERAVGRLQEEGFRPYWHQRVPPNDGGLALGQVVAARRYKASLGVA